VTTETTSDAADRVRELRAIAAEVAQPRAAIVAALDALDLQPGLHVLDVGCGPGVHLPVFAERVSPGGSVVGLDQESDRLQIAAEVCADLIAAGVVRLEQADATALPFAHDELDVAWASAVLHHVVDQAAMLAEMTRVVRPGGLVAIIDGDDSLSFPGMPWPPALEVHIRTAARRAIADNFGGTLPYHYDAYVGRRLPRLLREAGLVERRITAVSDVDHAPLTPRREEEIRNWLNRWFEDRVRGYLAPRDQDQVRALLDPASAGYLLSDPDFFFARTWLLATGRKAG
jgi:ubiquinone/menaquinone biosynthesis C-methylase UbiE